MSRFANTHSSFEDSRERKVYIRFNMKRTNPKKIRRAPVTSRFLFDNHMGIRSPMPAPTAPLNTTQFLISQFEKYTTNQSTPSISSVLPSSDSSLELELNPFGSMSSLMTIQRTAACRNWKKNEKKMHRIWWDHYCCLLYFFLEVAVIHEEDRWKMVRYRNTKGEFLPMGLSKRVKYYYSLLCLKFCVKRCLSHMLLSEPIRIGPESSSSFFFG